MARFSFIRTGVTGLALTIAAVAVWWSVTSLQAQRTIDRLEAMNADLERRLQVRQDMIDRLTRTRRIAHITIDRQILDIGGDVVSTQFTMMEVDDDGREIGRQKFTIPGATMFVDAWTVKFGHDDVAQGNPLAGRTLVLLKRVYSDEMSPREGLQVDLPGAIPPGYASSEVGQYERKLWESFWTIASDPKLASAMGVRVAQGEAVYKPVSEGERYELVVDADGGMNLTPMGRDNAKPALADADDAAFPQD